MLNLAQTQAEVKKLHLNPSTDVILNTNNPTAYNQAIKQLKALGWECRNLECVDNVPVFRLGPAAIRRDKKAGGWIVEINGAEFETSGTIAQINEKVAEVVAEEMALTPNPSPNGRGELAGAQAKAEALGAPVVTAASLPQVDLVIAVKKYGVGQTSSADAPIAWWKVAGQDKQQPKNARLTDPRIQERLQKYTLVNTVCREFEVVRRYRRLETAVA